MPPRPLMKPPYIGKPLSTHHPRNHLRSFHTTRAKNAKPHDQGSDQGDHNNHNNRPKTTHRSTTTTVSPPHPPAPTAGGGGSSLPPNATIFSGIQPTGIPHIGNYLGALLPWVKLQNEAPEDAKLLFSVVDLHALTTSGVEGAAGRGGVGGGRGGDSGGRDGGIGTGSEEESLWMRRKNGLAALLAVGIREDRCTVFLQGDVPAHAELMWILSCQASTGMLERMTQWKDKTKANASVSPKLGLFSYPVLQAADVLVHGATHVPVGEDQSQHLEFARYTARAFNAAYQTSILKEPTTIISPSKRILSLTRATPSEMSKMSKSNPSPKSRISILASPAEIRKRINDATTDLLVGTPIHPSGDPSLAGNQHADNGQGGGQGGQGRDSGAGLYPPVSHHPLTRPGISNLLTLLHAFSPQSHPQSPSRSHSHSIHDLAASFPTIRDLKHACTEAITAGLAPVRARYEDILHRDGGRYIECVALEGGAKARENADQVLKEVRRVVGLGPLWAGRDNLNPDVDVGMGVGGTEEVGGTGDSQEKRHGEGGGKGAEKEEPERGPWDWRNVSVGKP